MMMWLENFIQQISSIDFWVELFSYFRGFGPVAPILLAMIESFIPALPLMVIVTFNIGAYGAVLGFLYSWLGNVIGSTLVFLFFRVIVKKYLYHHLQKFKPTKKALEWVRNTNQSILFIISIFPFTPSSLVNVSFGLSDFSKKTFIITILCAKLFMMLFLTVFGNSIFLAFEQPLYLVLAILLLVVLLLLSKYFSNKHGL